MTDTANAPERDNMPDTIMAWPDFDGCITGAWSANQYSDERAREYVLSTHCDELVAAAKAEGAREAQAKLDELRSDRQFIVGWNEGFAEAEYQQANGKPSDGDLFMQYQHTAKEMDEAQEKIARLTEALAIAVPIAMKVFDSYTFVFNEEERRKFKILRDALQENANG